MWIGHMGIPAGDISRMQIEREKKKKKSICRVHATF